MESETDRSRPLSSSASARRRIPLSDSTNCLVPTSTILRKLSSALSTPPPFRTPIQKPKPNPNSNPNSKSSKPYNSSENKPDADSSKSETSIGSSNYNDNNAPNPKTLPQPHPSTPPRVYATNPGTRIDEVFDPLVVYGRRQTTGKKKDKGKAVALPFTRPFLRKIKDNENVDTVPVTSPPLQKTTDKGKAISVPFNCSLADKRRDKGKSVTVPSFTSPENTKDKVDNQRNKRKENDVPFSCPPLLRTRKMWNKFTEAKSCTAPHPKKKKRQQDVSMDALPQKFIEQQRAYFKEVDEFELLEEEISDSEFSKEECNNQDEVEAP